MWWFCRGGYGFVVGFWVRLCVCVCVFFFFFFLLVVFAVVVVGGGFGGWHGVAWWLLASGMVGLLGCE